MDTKVTVQILDYIASKYKFKGEKVNKLASLKLLFFAEKYHLMKYGRMISNDTFFAMKNGPVASEAKELLSFDDINCKDDYRDSSLVEIDKYHFSSTKKIKDYDMLSETDIEALNFSLDNFGNLDEWQLVEETHKYPEWKRYEKLFEINMTKRENIILDDFFKGSNEKSDPYNIIPNRVRELAKDLFFGRI